MDRKPSLAASARFDPERVAVPVISIDPTVTLNLLIAALELQRRSRRALTRLMRRVDRAASGPPDTMAWRRIGRRQAAGRRLFQEARTEGCLGSPPPTAPSRLEIRCFGRFEVARGGVPIEHWRRGKAKTLLKHLVVRRQPVPRDVLIDLLWPDADPQVAVNGLRVTLHALRQALTAGDPRRPGEVEYVIFEGGNYGLNPAVDLWVDAEEFSRHFVAGLSAERRGELAGAVRHFERAEEMYRDDYLLEDLYEDWTLVRREELKDQYLMVLTKLADACLLEGDADGCIVRCHKILQKDACREDAYRRLMQCYHQLGQRSQAIHWFMLCDRTLRQELEVAPAEQTIELYQRICKGASVAGPSAARQTSARPGPFPRSERRQAPR